MNQTFEAILLYCLWSLTLTVLIIFLRSYMTLTGQKSANSFAVTGDDVSPFSQRLIRAHANCYENLPITLGVLFSAILLGLESITNPLALFFILSRFVQSVTHLLSTSIIAVYIRFIFFFAQVSILLYWVIRILTAFR